MPGSLWGEDDILGQHADHGRNLLLAIHEFLAGVGLELVGHLTVDPGQDPNQVTAGTVLLQHLAQRLHEPRTFGGVAPREVTCGRERETSAQGDQGGNGVGGCAY